VQLSVLDASGHFVQSLNPVWVDGVAAGPLSLSTARLEVDGIGQVLIYDEQGRYLGAWNGVHADGGLAAPGAYRIQAQWSDASGPLAQQSVGMLLLPRSSALLLSLLVAPNPAGRDGRDLASLRWIPDGRTQWVRGSIYNVAGERVQAHEVLASQGRIDWNLRTPGGETVSGGVYLWEVEAVDVFGRVFERRAVKFVVVH
jgi:hypothetical protein